MYNHENRICGLMVRILASSAVDRWGQINDYKKLGSCFFSTNYAALKSKRKD